MNKQTLQQMKEDRTINSVDFYKALALDLTALLIIGGCVYSASRKGFLRMVMQAALYFGVFLLASHVSETAAPILYEQYVAPFVSEQTRDLENAVFASAEPKTRLAQLKDALGFLPTELDLDYWVNYAEDQVEDVKDRVIEEFLENTVRPIAIVAIRSMCFALIFFVCSGLGNWLLRALGIIRYLPVIGGVNAFFGAILGLGQGVLLVWLAGLLLHGLLILGQGRWWIFTPEIAQSSFIFRYFYDFRPLQLP